MILFIVPQSAQQKLHSLKAMVTLESKPPLSSNQLGLGDGFAIKYAVWFFADNPLAVAGRQIQSCFSPESSFQTPDWAFKGDKPFFLS